MKVTTEKLGQSKVQLTIEIPEEQFEESLQRAYKTVVQKITVPGFRKGKAPRKVLESMYGKEILLEDALQDAVPRACSEAIEAAQDEYTAVSSPEYDIVSAEIGKPIVFKATFEIKPEVALGEYKGIKLEKTAVEVAKEAIDTEIRKMQQRYAKLIVVEDEAAQEGDTVTIDFEGKIDEVPFEGGKGENYPLELGSHTFIPGFEDQLIGVKTGETKDITVTFPTEYPAENLAGKDAVFTVTVKEIKRKELAPLDDEFAKDVSEFDSMQELRNDIANKLKEAAEKKAENQLRLAAVKKVSENTQVEIPQAMIDNRVNQMINDFAYHLATQGITLEKYLEGTNTKIEDIKAYYEGEARSTVKADLVLEAVAKAEGIKATAEDVEKQIKRMAEQYKQEPEKIREALEKQGQLSGLEFGIMLDKAVDFVVEHAKVEIVPAQTAEAAGAPKESNAGETKATKEKTAK
ncbi:MAG TPA: trigger factor [Peptococcaceae bacterium]|jgi:trigger factor|nr:trigger factor [Clostridia bacterium]HOB82492.1 trigger factor [Peptococcaceae bacterium]HPZ72129.1 trigger factor [Peptococcaceae bacterium]HQD54425.1 trigger factor [Peptococcaceae bacterium]